LSILQEKLNIKILASETIYTIQRKHLVTVVLPLVSSVLMTIFFIVILMILSRLHSATNTLFSVDIVFLLLSFLAVFNMFTFANWFFEFYIITDKRILHIHFFKSQGEHFEEIFIAAGIEIKISRTANNLLYNILNVEDVNIEFRREYRQKQFIIQKPARPKEIEDILDTIAIGTIGRNK
jgi:hypothetical protein